MTPGKFDLTENDRKFINEFLHPVHKRIIDTRLVRVDWRTSGGRHDPYVRFWAYLLRKPRSIHVEIGRLEARWSPIKWQDWHRMKLRGERPRVDHWRHKGRR